MALDGWKSNLSPDATAYLERMERKLEGLTRKISSAESTISYLTKVTNRITSGSTSSGVVQGVIPSSVNVGSGSYSVATDGTVSFTGVSSVSLNGVFDGLGMDKYRIEGYFDTTGAATVSTRLRAAGVDTTTTSYVYTATSTTLSAGPVRNTSTTATSYGFWMPSATGPANIHGLLDLWRPGRVANTFMQMRSLTAGGGDRFLWNEGGSLGTGTQYDGVTVLASAGTMSGMLKVVKIA